MLKERDILNYLAGAKDDGLLKDIENWKLEDEQNAEDLMAFERIWQDAEKLKGHRAFDSDQAWQSVASKIGLAENQETKVIKMRPPRANMWSYWAVAASLALLVMTGLYFLQEKPELYAVIETAEQWQEITLQDGSVITLESNSKLRYPKTFDVLAERRIFLEGDATVNVAEDPNKEFVTENYGAGVLAVGTAYHISSDSTKSELENVNGKMQMYELVDTNNAVTLKIPGEKAVFDGGPIKFFAVLPPPPPDTPGVYLTLQTIVDHLSNDFDTRFQPEPGSLDYRRSDIDRVKVDMDQDILDIMKQLDSTANVDYSILDGWVILRQISKK